MATPQEFDVVLDVFSDTRLGLYISEYDDTAGGVVIEKIVQGAVRDRNRHDQGRGICPGDTITRIAGVPADALSTRDWGHFPVDGQVRFCIAKTGHAFVGTWVLDTRFGLGAFFGCGRDESQPGPCRGTLFSVVGDRSCCLLRHDMQSIGGALSDNGDVIHWDDGSEWAREAERACDGGWRSAAAGAVIILDDRVNVMSSVGYILSTAGRFCLLRLGDETVVGNQALDRQSISWDNGDVWQREHENAAPEIDVSFGMEDAEPEFDAKSLDTEHPSAANQVCDPRSCAHYIGDEPPLWRELMTCGFCTRSDQMRQMSYLRVHVVGAPAWFPTVRLDVLADCLDQGFGPEIGAMQYRNHSALSCLVHQAPEVDVMDDDKWESYTRLVERLAQISPLQGITECLAKRAYRCYDFARMLDAFTAAGCFSAAEDACRPFHVRYGHYVAILAEECGSGVATDAQAAYCLRAYSKHAAPLVPADQFGPRMSTALLGGFLRGDRKGVCAMVEEWNKNVLAVRMLAQCRMLPPELSELRGVFESIRAFLLGAARLHRRHSRGVRMEAHESLSLPAQSSA